MQTESIRKNFKKLNAILSWKKYEICMWNDTNFNVYRNGQIAERIKW